jgi:hypothetical protein
VIAADKNSTSVFPLPLELIGPLMQWANTKSPPPDDQARAT